MRPYPLAKAEGLTNPHPLMADHPLFSGGRVGLISAENPKFPEFNQGGGHEQIKAQLDQMGLPYEETEGHYETPERSFVVHGITREQLKALGKHFGQEAVIYSEGPHLRHFIYTHGPEGKVDHYHPELPTHDHWTDEEGPPEDYWTKMPGRGYLRLGFDFGKLHPEGAG